MSKKLLPVENSIDKSTRPARRFADEATRHAFFYAQMDDVWADVEEGKLTQGAAKNGDWRNFSNEFEQTVIEKLYRFSG